MTGAGQLELFAPEPRTSWGLGNVALTPPRTAAERAAHIAKYPDGAEAFYTRLAEEAAAHRTQ